MPAPTSGNVTLGLCATLLSVEDGAPKVLTITPPSHALVSSKHGINTPSLPFGPFTPEKDPTLDQGLRRWIKEQTNLHPRYVEQLYTFGNRFRDPQELKGGTRVVSVGYLGLLTPEIATGESAPHWEEVYTFLPWEDCRKTGKMPTHMHNVIKNLRQWAQEASSPFENNRRLQRLRLGFGLDGTPFDTERVLERYQILYEAGLVVEAYRDYKTLQGKSDNLPMSERFTNLPSPNFWAKYTGKPMILDHRRILASALQRLRGKIKYRPLIFELLPETFTLLHLQKVAEALAGIKLHKQNFRRLVLSEKLVEETEQTFAEGRGRPAILYKFREDVRYERAAPGVGLPRF